MSADRMKRGYLILGSTLALFLALTFVLDKVGSYQDRLERRNAILKAEIEKTDRDAIRAASADRWIEYPSARQVNESDPPEGPLVIAANFATHSAGQVDFSLVLRCEPAGKGPRGFQSQSTGTYVYTQPTVLGFRDQPERFVGYARRSSHFRYRGELPQADADCVLTVAACRSVEYDVRKCAGLDIEPIRIRIRL